MAMGISNNMARKLTGFFLEEAPCGSTGFFTGSSLCVPSSRVGVRGQGREREKAMLKEKAIPLYYQLETILRRRILARDFFPDAPLPSEEALGQEYDVSRITVRQALSSLERDGLIVRRRGKGTFVVEKAFLVETPKLTGSIEDLILMGIQTSTKILSTSIVDPPETIRNRLELVANEQVYRIEKVRSVEKESFSYVINYLPSRIGEKIRMESLKVKPLLMVLEDDLGIRANGADQTIEATVADALVAPLLDIRVGDPLLKVERTVYDIKGKPVEYVSVLYRADKYFFNVKLKRKRSKDSVGWRAV
jgi:GntR family transcriptional regulator